MLATTPSGSWPMRSLMPPSLKTVSSFVAASTSARKKSMRARKPFSSLRDCASGLPTSCVSVRASVSSSVATARRKRAIEIARLASGVACHAGCAFLARSAFFATLAASSAGTSAISEPSAGLVIFSLLMRVRAARAAARKSSSSGRSSSVPSPLRWNSGCHCTAAMNEPDGRRIASIMPSAGHVASTTKPGARSLIPWWWTLLTVAARVPSKISASRVPATNATPCRLRS